MLFIRARLSIFFVCITKRIGGRIKMRLETHRDFGIRKADPYTQ